MTTLVSLLAGAVFGAVWAIAAHHFLSGRRRRREMDARLRDLSRDVLQRGYNSLNAEMLEKIHERINVQTKERKDRREEQ